MLSRLDRIEQEVVRQANYVANSPGLGSQCRPISLSIHADVSASATKRGHLPEAQPTGLAQLINRLGALSIMICLSPVFPNVPLISPGQTSTFVIASSLGKRLRQLEDVSDTNTSAKLRRTDPNLGYLASPKESSWSIDLDELTSFCDYVIPPNVLRSDCYLREDIADRHLDGLREPKWGTSRVSRSRGLVERQIHR